jgi:hypothetical protein
MSQVCDIGRDLRPPPVGTGGADPLWHPTPGAWLRDIGLTIAIATVCLNSRRILFALTYIEQ